MAQCERIIATRGATPNTIAKGLSPPLIGGPHHPQPQLPHLRKALRHTRLRALPTGLARGGGDISVVAIPTLLPPQTLVSAINLKQHSYVSSAPPTHIYHTVAAPPSFSRIRLRTMLYVDRLCAKSGNGACRHTSRSTSASSYVRNAVLLPSGGAG